MEWILLLARVAVVCTLGAGGLLLAWLGLSQWLPPRAASGVLLVAVGLLLVWE